MALNLFLVETCRVRKVQLAREQSGDGKENQDGEEVEMEVEHESEESDTTWDRIKAIDIWEGFSILRKCNGKSAKCTACKKLLANSGRSGTSLWRSLNSIPTRQTCPDFNAARRAMVMFIITSGESLSIVESPYLQDLARTLHPAFPLCRTVSDIDITNLYERESSMLNRTILTAPGLLSFSIDHWKSKATGHKYTDDIYISVTACFVDADWNLQRRMVGFRLLDFPDDALSVAETVTSCLDHFDVEKVMCITLDNALYDDSVVNSVKTALHDEGKLFCYGELYHVHCCTDVLNSAVQAGVELIADVIEKIRQGIHYINFSGVRKDKFYKYAKDSLHLDVTIKLRADIVFYWDLTYKMIQSVLYYKDAFNHFASTDEIFLSHFHLSDEEWTKLATMEKFLKPLYDITCTFLRRETKTANLYFLGVYKVHRLLDVTKGQESFMYGMVEDIKAKFDKYWSENSLMLACAAVFDPRYKLNLISYCFRKIYGDADANQHIDRVVALLRRLFTVYEKSSSASVRKNDEYHTKDDLFDDYAAPKQTSELDWYLESQVMDLNVDMDILVFWSGMSKCYPDLANLARDILAIPMSTVASKSAFTLREKVLNPRRSALSPPFLLEMLISLHDWTCPKDRDGIAVSAIEEHFSDDEDEDQKDGIKESNDHEEEEMNIEESD
ncbi:hypothetical protein ACP4OV_029021 [Aristida adscensionis]